MHHRRYQLAASLGLVASTAACSNDDSGRDTFGYTSAGLTTAATTDSSGTDGATTDDTGPEVYDVGDGDPTAGNTGGDGGNCACKNVEDGIYVLSSGSTPAVYFFDPPANTFTEVGVLGCQAPGMVANSMAIDRQGFAWLNYYDLTSQTGKLFKAPLSDLSACEELGYSNDPGSWFLLGMGYAVTDPGGSCDELFIYKSDRYLEYPNFGPGGSEIGQFNEATAEVEPIAPTDYPVGELTGTGDGRLFTFAAVGNNQTVLVNLDKETGEELEVTDVGIDVTNSFAFAFWGGDVYFFTETSPNSGVSKVTRLDYDGNEGGGMMEYNGNAGIRIPGAGVSTCASFLPPG